LNLSHGSGFNRWNYEYLHRSYFTWRVLYVYRQLYITQLLTNGAVEISKKFKKKREKISSASPGQEGSQGLTSPHLWPLHQITLYVYNALEKIPTNIFMSFSSDISTLTCAFELTSSNSYFNSYCKHLSLRSTLSKYLGNFYYLLCTHKSTFVDLHVEHNQRGMGGQFLRLISQELCYI
jgi:hypothetical protein